MHQNISFDQFLRKLSNGLCAIPVCLSDAGRCYEGVADFDGRGESRAEAILASFPHQPHFLDIVRSETAGTHVGSHGKAHVTGARIPRAVQVHFGLCSADVGHWRRQDGEGDYELCEEMESVANMLL